MYECMTGDGFHLTECQPHAVGMAQSLGATCTYTTTGTTSEERDAQGQGPALSYTAWSGAPGCREFPPHPLRKPTHHHLSQEMAQEHFWASSLQHRAVGPSTWPSGHHRREERRAATQNHWEGAHGKGSGWGRFPQDPLKEGLKTFCVAQTPGFPHTCPFLHTHLAGPMVTSSFPQPAACSPRTQQPLGLICPGPWSILSPGGRPEPSLCLVPFILLRRSHTLPPAQTAVPVVDRGPQRPTSWRAGGPVPWLSIWHPSVDPEPSREGATAREAAEASQLCLLQWSPAPPLSPPRGPDSSTWTVWGSMAAEESLGPPGLPRGGAGGNPHSDAGWSPHLGPTSLVPAALVSATLGTSYCGSWLPSERMTQL